MNIPGWFSDSQLEEVRWKLANGDELDSDDRFLLGLHVVQHEIGIPAIARPALAAVCSCRPANSWFLNRTTTFLHEYPGNHLGELVVRQDMERAKAILSGSTDRCSALLSQIITGHLVEGSSRLHDKGVILALDDVEGADWYNEEVLMEAASRGNLFWIERMLRAMPNSPSSAVSAKLWNIAMNRASPDVLKKLCQACRPGGLNVEEGIGIAIIGQIFERNLVTILSTPESREHLSARLLYETYSYMRQNKMTAIRYVYPLPDDRELLVDSIGKYDRLVNALNEVVEQDEGLQRGYLSAIFPPEFNAALISYFRTGRTSTDAPRVSEEAIIDVLDSMKPISPKVLVAAVQEGNLAWFERLLPLTSPLSLADHHSIWREAICNRESDTLSRLCESGLLPVDYASTAKTSLSSWQGSPLNALEIAVANSRAAAIDTILSHAITGKQLSVTDLEHVYQQAIVKGDADCAFELAKHLGVESTTVAVCLLMGNVNGDLGTMPDIDDIKLRIHQVGYFTSLPAVDKWVTALKKAVDESNLVDTEKQLLLTTIKDEEQDLLDWLPYVGRYVRTVDQQGVTKAYQSGAMEIGDQSFFQRQRKHADTMREQVKKRIDGGEFSSLVESQQFYAIERDSLAAFGPGVSDSEAVLKLYRTPRDVGGIPLHTNFFVGNSQVPTRYDSDYPIAKQEMALQRQHQGVSKDIRRLVSEGTRQGELYTLTYEGAELTAVFFDGIVWRWLHSEPATIRDHWEKVEAIVSSLLAAHIGPRDAEWFASYKRQWLTAFWLSSNFCLFPRGSAQGTQNSLNEVCKRQQVPAPIARKEHPMLNTIAISLPLEEFLERIDEFIEPWKPPLDTEGT